MKSIDETLDNATPKVAKPEDLPEAPASATVKAWNEDNFGVMFTLRDVDGRKLYSRMTNFLKVLKSDGWKPDWHNGSQNTQTAVKTQPTTPEGITSECTHAEVKVLEVKKEGANKGKHFKSCKDCGKFLGFIKV